MEEYIRFMKRKNTKNVIMILIFCALAFLTFAAIAFLNTRFNGFADVHPAAYYFEKLAAFWQKICEALALYPKRFINFFQ